MKHLIRVGSLEIRRTGRFVTIIQTSEDESKPFDFIVIRKLLEAETLTRVLGQVFAARIWRRIANEELRDAADMPSAHMSAVTLGRRGGKKGGKARAERLSPKRRSEIARAAARKRWEK